MRTTTLRATVIGVACLLASATAARAGDYCIDINNGVSLLVLKAFAPPGKGACNEARGFLDLAADYFSGGSACRSTDGSHVSFVLARAIGSAGDTLRAIDFLHLDLATDTGLGTFCNLDTGSGGGCAAVPITHVPCNPKIVPVP